MTILDKIVRKKGHDIKKMGAALGAKIPNHRSVPIVSIKKSPFIICEIKRSSPSRGIIIDDIDPVKQAIEYKKRGIKAISILTEKRFFSGSLNDLISVKKTFPELSVLRKDFIISEEEVDISFKAGADAILLIASIHPLQRLYKLYNRAKRYGMNVLFEVHSENDIKKANYIKPDITGINSRDLNNFKIDLFYPLRLKSLINWKTTTVFESGIKSKEDALFALSSGFNGILIGEAVIKKPELIENILKIYNKNISNFWDRLYKYNNRPLIKVCGITKPKDAYYLEEKGANILGFIFAPSPRMTNYDLLKELKDINLLKVGVITPKSFENKEIKRQIEACIDEKLFDALQLHGFTPSFRLDTKFLLPYYHAVRIKDLDDVKLFKNYTSPRILVDSFDKNKEGGTGKSIPEKIIIEIKRQISLWIAGGIGIKNVREIVEKFKPELVDTSSLLEKSVGIKDHSKLDKFFEEIKNAENIQ